MLVRSWVISQFNETLKISWCLAMAEFSVKSFVLFVWWRVFEACLQSCSSPAGGSVGTIWNRMLLGCIPPVKMMIWGSELLTDTDKTSYYIHTLLWFEISFNSVSWYWVDIITLLSWQSNPEFAGFLGFSLKLCACLRVEQTSQLV